MKRNAHKATCEHKLLVLHILKPSGYFVFCIPPILTHANLKQCIYVFRMDLRTNSDNLSIQHYLTGFIIKTVFTARYGPNLCVMYINPSKRSGHYMYHQFNIQQFYVLPTRCIYCVLCGSQNKQRLFLYTAITDCFLLPRRNVFTARKGLDI